MCLCSGVLLGVKTYFLIVENPGAKRIELGEPLFEVLLGHAQLIALEVRLKLAHRDHPVVVDVHLLEDIHQPHALRLLNVGESDERLIQTNLHLPKALLHLLLLLSLPSVLAFGKAARPSLYQRSRLGALLAYRHRLAPPLDRLDVRCSLSIRLDLLPVLDFFPLAPHAGLDLARRADPPLALLLFERKRGDEPPAIEDGGHEDVIREGHA